MLLGVVSLGVIQDVAVGIRDRVVKLELAPPALLAQGFEALPRRLVHQRLALILLLERLDHVSDELLPLALRFLLLGAGRHPGSSPRGARRARAEERGEGRAQVPDRDEGHRE